MAINTKIATDIAFKRLAANKTFTNPTISGITEPIGSNVQSSADIIFGEKIPSAPGATSTATKFDTASGVIQLVEFDLIAIGDSIYEADASGFGSTTANQFDTTEDGGAVAHAFALHFPSDYESNNGSNSVGLSQNPKAGTGFFKNNLALTGSGGSVQIVPALYGADYGFYVSSSTGPLNVGSDAQDFYLDTFSGVLIRQDGDDSSAQLPTKVGAYIYIGKMVSESLGAAEVPTLQSVTDVGASTTNDIIISGSLTVSGSVAEAHVVDFSGANSTTVSTFNATGNADIDGDLNVDGGAVIDGTLQVDGNVTLGNSTGDQVVIAGDLTVQGNTTTINTANLAIEDKFILLASSSTGTDLSTYNSDGGIIVQRGNDDAGKLAGTALFYDADRQSWGITAATSSNPANLADAEDTDINAEINIATIDVRNGSPLSANQGGTTVDLPRPQMGADSSAGNGDGRFALGQMYVDYNDTTNGGLYIYLPNP